MLLALTKGYRTVSREALPIDIKATEIKQLYDVRVGRGGNMANKRREAMRKWQERWDRATTGRRTHGSLPNMTVTSRVTRY